ncbi:unnamed protein product [Peniophora sp. CBMAI 1063]|nr:unnamed protein product [Peniophora sp. CBMAI 1063]
MTAHSAVRRMNAQKRHGLGQHTKSKSVPATLSTKSTKTLQLGRSSSVGSITLGARTSVKRRRPSVVSQARAPVVPMIAPTPARAAPPELSRVGARSVPARRTPLGAIFDNTDEYDISFPTFDAAVESDEDPSDSMENPKLHGFEPEDNALFALEDARAITRRTQSPLASLVSPSSSFSRSNSDDSEFSSPSAGPSRIWTSSPEPSMSGCSTDDSQSVLASPPQSFSSSMSALDHIPGQYKRVRAHQPVVERVAGACAVRVEHWTPLAPGLRPPQMSMSVSDSWARPSSLRFNLQSPTPSHTPRGLPYPPTLGSPQSPRPGSPLSKSWSIQSASSASASQDEDVRVQSPSKRSRPTILRKLSAEVFSGFGGGSKRPAMHGRGFSSPAVPRVVDLKEGVNVNEAGGRPLSLLVTAKAPEERRERRGSGFLRRRVSSSATVKAESRRSVFGLRLR